MLREFQAAYYNHASSSLDDNTILLKGHLYTSKNKIHELTSLLVKSKTPFFDLMIAHGYSPPVEKKKEEEENKRLSLDDIFFPSIISQLTSTVENLMLYELRNFCSTLALGNSNQKMFNIDHILMLLARRFLGKDLRKMSPVVVVGERALEETEKKGRTASVIALTPCE